MKQVSAVIVTGIFLLLINTITYSQRVVHIPNTIIIEPYPLQVAFYKTTHLIFPYAIKSVDRGSLDVLAQKAKGVNNILLVKAGRENFRETNLSVITADGNLYSFILNYSNNPSFLNISFIKDTSDTTSLLHVQNNEGQMQATAAQVAKEKRTIYGIKESKYRMLLGVTGVYIKNNIIFCQVEVQNHSTINYDIDMFRFFIKDEKKAKRIASQEIEIQPLSIYGDTAFVKGQSKNKIVFVLPKFTIPDKKFLLIQLMEKNGGRHLSLIVHNRTLFKAKPLE